MSFIRQQRNVSTGYNPNTRHCVCGLVWQLCCLLFVCIGIKRYIYIIYTCLLYPKVFFSSLNFDMILHAYMQDADLIMLALATHEVHFSILREVNLNHFCKFKLIGRDEFNYAIILYGFLIFTSSYLNITGASNNRWKFSEEKGMV
jgi:hypothetical protein